MKFCLAVGAAVLVMCGAAEASTVIAPPDPQAERWLTQMRLPSPDVQVEIRYESCPGLPGDMACAYTADGVIYLSPADRRRTLYHELGHFFDAYELGEDGRMAFLRLAGEPGVDWVFPSPYQAFSPQETFATTYAFLAHLRHPPGWAKGQPRSPLKRALAKYTQFRGLVRATAIR